MIELTREWVIDEIIDTRNRDCEFKPIPGSGVQVPCECCGRTIEVHAEIRNIQTKARAVVGTQCCKKAGKHYRTYSPTCKSMWRVTGRTPHLERTPISV